jgi:predicted RNase H-like HicB family nuclease
VLDREIFNPEVEAEWAAHFQALSDEELHALSPEAICAGLQDRIMLLALDLSLPQIVGHFGDAIGRTGSLSGIYNEGEAPMEIVKLESIPIVVGREDDGRWWADIESMPGVMAYGATRESAIAAVRALALQVAADCIDHGEEVPEPFAKVFSVA